MAKDPYQYFRPEARDLLDQLNKGLLELEQGGHDVVPRLLRLAHTLKGAARVVKQGAIADHAHAIEDALAPFREPAAAMPPARIDAILKILDAIGGQISALDQPQNPPQPQSGQPSPGTAFKTIRADVAEMDALLDGVTESNAQLNTLRRTIAAVDRGRHLADLLAEQLAPRRTGEDASAAAVSSKAYATAAELQQVFGGIERHLRGGLDQLERELRQLREAAEQLRLIPAGIMFVSLERTVRDTAQMLDKSVRFEGRGHDVRLESQVLTAIEGAFVQLARNAVAHGIESERDRKAAGKAPTGRVTMDVSRRGRQVIFRCKDDGRGIDLDEVRRVAKGRGLSPLETAKLGAEDLMRLLLRGGISTSSPVTEVSGRGIGLDIVRNAAEQLSGEVTVLTEPGRGTTVDIVVPLFLASLEVLLVEVGGFVAAIPLDAVREARRVTAGEISRTPRGDSVVYNGKAVPFLRLHRALQVRTQVPRSLPAWSGIIVESANGLAAVGVDRFLGTRRLIVRPLPDLVAAAAVVAGTSLDAEGNPQLVLEPDGLVVEAQREDGGDVEPMPAHGPLLVVDDSLTTRMLEKSILESAGFDVDTAISAEEALEAARRKSYTLFLVDIEMPGMDGFTFIERIRLDASLRDVPAILVTSRDSPEDRQRGVQVGAQDYIVKSEFNQAELLRRIRQLTGHGENASAGGRGFPHRQKTAV
jgi:two-component system chemotaxis sensor kinase CheA